jgi:hypothetical protein
MNKDHHGPQSGFASNVLLRVCGFAARCEAVALPRRNKRRMICGCAAGAGFALILAGPKAVPGAEPIDKSHCYGGAKPPPHIERQSRTSHSLRLSKQSPTEQVPTHRHEFKK